MILADICCVCIRVVAIGGFTERTPGKSCEIHLSSLVSRFDKRARVERSLVAYPSMLLLASLISFNIDDLSIIEG